MLSFLKKQFGAAGLVVAIIALIAAVAGGAYAASGGLTGKQKKEVTKIAKQYAGKNGSPGAQGPAGTPGAKGDTGAKGEPGAPGPLLEALPSGKTLKGEWGAAAGIEGGGLAEPVPGTAVANISFPFPLSTAPTLNYIFKDPEGGGSVFGLFLSGDGAQLGTLSEAQAKTVCPGSGAEPRATAGNLCVYASQETLQEAKSPFSQPAWSGKYDQPTKFGANIVFRFFESQGTVAGTWAVTAP